MHMYLVFFTQTISIDNFVCDFFSNVVILFASHYYWYFVFNIVCVCVYLCILQAIDISIFVSNYPILCVCVCVCVCVCMCLWNRRIVKWYGLFSPACRYVSPCGTSRLMNDSIYQWPIIWYALFMDPGQDARSQTFHKGGWILFQGKQLILSHIEKGSWKQILSL